MTIRYSGTAVIVLVIYLAAFYPAGKNSHTCKCQQHSAACPCCLASVSGPVEAPQVLSKSQCCTKKPEEILPKVCGLDKCEERGAHAKNTGESEPKDYRCRIYTEQEDYSTKNKGQERLKLSGFCKCKETKDHYKNSSIAVLFKLVMIGRPSGDDKIRCWEKGLLLPGYRHPPMKPPPV